MTRSVFRAWLLTGSFALLPASTITLRARHTDFKGGEPAPNSRVSVAPTRIALWFTERPQLAFSRIRLMGSGGAVSLDALAADTGSGIHATVRGAMPPGAYRVVWQTAGADGHTLNGEYSFTLAGAGETAMGHQMPLATDTSRPLPAHVVAHRPSPAERVMRWWEYFALLASLGVLAFIHLVLPPLAARGVPTADASAQARGLGEIAVAIYFAAAVFRLLREMAAVRTAWPDGSGPSVASVVGGSPWGQAWLLGIVGGLLLLAGLLALRKRYAIGTPLALAGACGMALSPALSGHAASASRFVLTVTLDAVHVASLGVWIGGLLVVVLVGVPAMARLTDGNAHAAVSALVNSFHPIALVSAPLAVVAGVGNALQHVTTLTALSSAYGSTLLVKLGLVAVLAALGAYNSTRARRRLGTSAATKHLRRMAIGELVFASLVLAVTTNLVSEAVPSPLAAP